MYQKAVAQGQSAGAIKLYVVFFFFFFFYNPSILHFEPWYTLAGMLLVYTLVLDLVAGADKT